MKACLHHTGRGSLFEVDTIRNIMLEVCKIAHVEYTGGSGNTDVSLRVITDHIRTATFLIGDGSSSNEGGAMCSGEC